MAFQLKQLLQTNQDADRLWTTDKTGAYVASFNETGWGTPNPVLAQSALLFVAIRKASTEEQLSPVGTALLHNGAAPNTLESQCEFTYTRDGWHRVTQMQFDVSLNGTTLVKDGSTIAENAYCFYNGNVYQKLSGILTIVDPSTYKDLIGEVSIIQDYSEGIFYAKLSVKYNDLYREYSQARDCSNDDAEYLYRKVRDLRFNLESAFNLFWSGLTSQAHDLIESLYDKYGLE